MKNMRGVGVLGLVVLVVLGGVVGYSQAPGKRASGGPGNEAASALAEPFKGVTTNGEVQRGLFELRATGVSTEPIAKAAATFIASLTEAQRGETLYAFDDIEWRRWHNIHRAPREGVSFKEMTEDQRRLAFDLFRASLSAKGVEKTRDIMRLNHTVAEMTQKFDEYGEGLYWITIMGTPSTAEPWGWQLDGHHLVINYSVVGDQVVMTPTFMGSEPVRAEAGKYKGTVVLQDEQNKGLALMRALDDKQQSAARIKGEHGPSETLAQAYRDNLVLDYAGLPAADMTEPQRRLLLETIAEYVGNMSPGHAKVRMAEVEKHLPETRFVWIGGTADNAVFYYRIHSPVILIEFDHQRPIALGRSDVPTRQHIHTVVRTPNGNDYGKDLLRQHLLKHPHGGDMK